MFVNEKMKLNKLVQVAIPKPREYFRKFGLNGSAGSYSGDSVAQMPQTKIESIVSASRENDRTLYEEMQKANVPPAREQSE